MGKKIKLVSLILICLLVFVGCGCEHVWADATCLAPATCTECGKEEGELGAHQWQEATCEAPRTCTLCGGTEGDALGHHFDDPTCDAPATCSVCGHTEGEKLEHQWENGICTNVCLLCGVEEDPDGLGHIWKDATCQEPKTCRYCNKTEGAPAAHTWEEATCMKARTCTECDTTEGDLADHDWVQADCDYPKRCTWCGKTEGAALGHTLGENTTAELGVCVTCNKTIELYYPDDGGAPGKLAAAWTVYDIGEDGKPIDPISYVYKSSGLVQYKWETNGRSAWNSLYVNSAYTDIDIYYVDGKFYYYHASKYTYSSATPTFLASVAKEYVDFAEAIWLENKNHPGAESIDLMPSGWTTTMDDIGSAHLAEDVYGNQYVIVRGDDVGLLAVQRDWQGVTTK